MFLLHLSLHPRDGQSWEEWWRTREVQLSPGTQVSPAALCHLLWPLLQTRQPRRFGEDCRCPVNSGHRCGQPSLPRQPCWFTVTGAVSCAGLLCSHLLEQEAGLCWTANEVWLGCFPYDPMSALRAPSEKQTSCHLHTEPGNSRENFLSEIKHLQSLNLPSPVLVIL